MPPIVFDIAVGWATLLLFGGGILLLRAPDTLHRVLALDVLVAIVIVLLTILQSWSQGVEVWGEGGMRKLWSAANVKVYGGGVTEVGTAAPIGDI